MSRSPRSLLRFVGLAYRAKLKLNTQCQLGEETKMGKKHQVGLQDVVV